MVMTVQVKSVCVSDLVDAGSRQGGFIQVIKVRVSHGLTCRDPLGRIVGQHFLQEGRKVRYLCAVTLGDNNPFQGIYLRQCEGINKIEISIIQPSLTCLSNDYTGTSSKSSRLITISTLVYQHQLSGRSGVLLGKQCFINKLPKSSHSGQMKFLRFQPTDCTSYNQNSFSHYSLCIYCCLHTGVKGTSANLFKCPSDALSLGNKKAFPLICITLKNVSDVPAILKCQKKS